jgi:hypothetical protein
MPYPFDSEVVLEVTSFTFIGSIGAEHYYGKLKRYVGGFDDIVEVSMPMTQDDADKLNRKDQCDTYQAGDSTIRFDSEEAVVRRARQVWRKHFPKARVLFLGRSGVMQPQKVLVGPAAYKKAVNAMWRRMERLDWRDNEDEMSKLCEAFYKLEIEP